MESRCWTMGPALIQYKAISLTVGLYRAILVRDDVVAEMLAGPHLGDLRAFVRLTISIPRRTHPPTDGVEEGHGWSSIPSGPPCSLACHGESSWTLGCQCSTDYLAAILLTRPHRHRQPHSGSGHWWASLATARSWFLSSLIQGCSNVAETVKNDVKSEFDFAVGSPGSAAQV
jgi:hypothetical protein